MSKISELCNPTRFSVFLMSKADERIFRRHKNNFWLTLYDMAMTRGLHSPRYSLWSMLLICEHCDSSKSHRKCYTFFGVRWKLFKKCWRWKIVRTLWWEREEMLEKVRENWWKFDFTFMNIRGVRGSLINLTGSEKLMKFCDYAILND